MSKKITLRNVRLSYEHIFTPAKFDEGSDAKYSATLIIPKDHPDLDAVKRAFYEAGKEAFPDAFTGKGWPKGYACGLKDADTETDSMGQLLAEKNAAYAGSYILEANSSRRPLVVGRRKEALTEDDGVVYAGCYINVSLGVSGYTYGKVKRGVKAYLNGVQFVKDGERFGTDVSADFDNLDGEAGEDDGWM